MVSAWRAYAHFYAPIFTSAVLLFTIPNPFEHRVLLLASAIPTHFLASLVHQSRPRPSERFTHHSDLRRALVLFAYGRLLGTPFNLMNYVKDLFAIYGISAVLDRAEGEPPRKSEFFAHALIACATTLLFGFTPPSWETTWVIMGSVDRVMYRAAWLALVDDVVKVLAYPNLGTKKERVVVLLVQAIMIAISVLWTYFMVVVGGRKMVEADFMSPIDG